MEFTIRSIFDDSKLFVEYNTLKSHISYQDISRVSTGSESSLRLDSRRAWDIFPFSMLHYVVKSKLDNEENCMMVKPCDHLLENIF